MVEGEESPTLYEVQTSLLLAICCLESVHTGFGIHMDERSLWQTQKHFPTWTIGERSHSEPTRCSVSLLILGSSADTDGISDHFATGGGGSELRLVCKTTDELHASESIGAGGAECASCVGGAETEAR